ncbi:helix-turn-helix transcriptional regulator [Victivallis sp. Marseille-Q1083]|uniref:helix-turn-helix domain-containing protein n=1 Tax=Victivallis sp. Marseille-Q1083 TaxID=2717288 RepID=UPI00158EEF40|nr:helix-turn-helix domain-containing protein [Victivallis sp. Marseille-Q1083]
MTQLTEMIRKRQITQAKLATELKISRPAVSMLAKKGIRSIRTARKYARVLQCDPLFLLD